MLPVKRSLLFSLLFCVSAYSQSYTVSGGSGEPYPESTAVGTNIEKIYLLNGLSGAYIEYTPRGTSSVIFFKYTNSTGDAAQIPASDITSNGITHQIHNLQDARGYYAQEGGVNQRAIWIIDYSNGYQPTINSVGVDVSSNENERCKDKVMSLIVDKTEPTLQYYATAGVSHPIQRKYKVEYETLKWDGINNIFSDNPISQEKEFHDRVSIDSPLKNTVFTVSGDQFARHFGMDQSSHSEEYRAVVVEAHIISKEVVDGLESDTSSVIDLMSAPIEFNFYGIANDPTADYYKWSVYHNDPERKNPILQRVGDKNVNYTFTQSGKYEVVLEVSSVDDLSCTATESVAFTISESELLIPNFFTPDDSPGVNDEFKVKHKSIVKFKCTIFNRWGNKIYEWTDPDKGWDGKYKGKFVNTGVYFYVINAVGSDGVKYKKGGDINILRGK